MPATGPRGPSRQKVPQSSVTGVASASEKCTTTGAWMGTSCCPSRGHEKVTPGPAGGGGGLTSGGAEQAMRVSTRGAAGRIAGAGRPFRPLESSRLAYFGAFASLFLSVGRGLERRDVDLLHLQH